jgi:hypothetical protein
MPPSCSDGALLAAGLLRPVKAPQCPANGDASDPLPLSALLLAAVDAHRASTGASDGEVARLAGIHFVTLSRIRHGAPMGPDVARALLRALGLRVVLVPA